MKNIIILSLIFVVFGCKPKLDKEVSFNAGTANFSNTLYFGDHLLSGYTNDGLYNEGQENSIATIISNQLKQVGSNENINPDMQGNGSGFLKISNFENGNFTVDREQATTIGKTSILNFDCNSDSSLPVFQNFTGKITNYAFPQLKVRELNQTLLGNANSGGYNPFFERVTSSDESYINYISNLNPTFFFVAFGLSDILESIKNGWSCGTTTSEEQFTSNYQSLLDVLTNKTDKGVLCEVPSVDKLSFLNVNYSTDEVIYIQSKRYINQGYEVRKYEQGDQFLRETLTKIGVNGYGLSDSLPIKNSDIIDRFEKAEIAAEIDRYNLLINSLASKYNLPVVAMDNYLLKEKGLLGDSIVLNGTNTSIDYKLGSAVSLDGIFPTPRGAAAIANKFISTINERYDANIPLADINNYPGLKLK